MKILQLILISIGLLSGLTTTGQTVDLVGDCSTIKVRVDQSLDNQLMSALTFTVSWPANQTASWKNLSSVLIYPTTTPRVEGDRKYLTLVAFGFDLIDIEQEMELISFNGAPVRIEHSSRLDNSQFFVSINGVTATGQIYDQCESESRVRVYPNPTDGVLYISILSGSFRELLLLDLKGTTVASQNIQQDQRLIEISLHQLPNGVYSIYLLGCDKYTQKVVLSR